MRLDKFLANMGRGSRSQVKRLIASGAVTVDGKVAHSAKMQIDAGVDQIALAGQVIAYQPFVYLMLNKAQGYISSTARGAVPTVLDCVPAEYRHYDLFPIGRLDKDTNGLLIISNDGQLAHQLLAPTKHVAKTYRVICEDAISSRQIAQLRAGVKIAQRYLTKPATVEAVDATTIDLTICEGKYHQVKQMLKAVGNGVRQLERIAFAGLALDRSLARGTVRPLTAAELAHLKALVEK